MKAVLVVAIDRDGKTLARRYVLVDEKVDTSERPMDAGLAREIDRLPLPPQSVCWMVGTKGQAAMNYYEHRALVLQACASDVLAQDVVEALIEHALDCASDGNGPMQVVGCANLVTFVERLIRERTA